MECASCKSSIPASFGHAIRKNECPACGQAIMDEEALALLDDLRTCVSSAVRLRDEAVERIALAVMASYDIALKGLRQPPASQPDPPTAAARQSLPQTKVQRREPQQYEQEGSEVEEDELEEGIVQTADLVDPNKPISDDERERIMAERVAARYQMVPQDQLPDARKVGVRQSMGANAMSDAELLNNPIVEQERMVRLQRQDANMAAGLSSVRRSER